MPVGFSVLLNQLFLEVRIIKCGSTLAEAPAIAQSDIIDSPVLVQRCKPGVIQAAGLRSGRTLQRTVTRTVAECPYLLYFLHDLAGIARTAQVMQSTFSLSLHSLGT